MSAGIPVRVGVNEAIALHLVCVESATQFLLL